MTEGQPLVQELVQKSQAGDLAAFERLAEMFRDRLEGSVRSRLAHYGLPAAEVEEVVQETFARALQAIERFEWRGEDAFYRWMSGIAHRVILVTARQARRASGEEVPLNRAGKGVSPSRAMSREERFRRLQESIAGLSDDHREVVLLARIEGLTMKEIAARMGKTPGAVRQLLFRALGKLKDVFGDTESLGLPDRRLNGNGGTEPN